MSLDDVRRYQRELERIGADPREVAAGLLGVTFDRYLLLARPYEAPRGASIQAEEIAALEAQRPTEPEPRWRRMTGVSRGRVLEAGVIREASQELPERWRALWALPFTTVEEMERVVGVLRERSVEYNVWDASVAFWWLAAGVMPSWTYHRLEEGWRSPHRDGPAMERIELPGPYPSIRTWSEDAQATIDERARVWAAERAEARRLLTPP